MSENTTKLLTFVNESDEVTTIPIRELHELTWSQMVEWMSTTGVKDTGSALRDYYCKQNGIELKIEDLPERDTSDENLEDFWKNRTIHIEHKQGQERERLAALLKCIRQDFLEHGVKSVEFDWAGSGDDMSYAEAQVIFADDAQEESDEENSYKFFDDWNSFLDHLSSHVVNSFYSCSFNNEGGGGNAEWNLKDNTFDYYSYYNEIKEIEDEEGTGTMEIA